METITVDILNPKAKSLLKNLADLNLIKINKVDKKSDFSSLLKHLRNNNPPLSLDEITEEIEVVRKSRHEK
ncbi:hypothetical protein DN752_02550 [Echinicola strongylocentroti]|uniref:Uncharacterized protein n=1 Tax=Echinicola strongylocentroti TaxID=1795355 RepID=A0A2Z4IF53_9BACT|nr:hypothetical protein [Echinicola strongylocentroti]AWW29108.1 hypothetical protein DN752_02550 [Echinicola strongylocentroti]